jgi:alpha-ketoglutarate-dependent taurine dioxygenase
VVRTNPVTGWKSLFAVGNHVSKINDITADESRRLQDWFLQMIVEEHDAQLRHRWENEFDVGTWMIPAPPCDISPSLVRRN